MPPVPDAHVSPGARRGRGGRRHRGMAAALPVALTLLTAALLTACSGSSASPQGSGSPSSAPASSSPASTPSSSSSPSAAGPPAVVAVTKAGALVLLDSATGSVARTLVPGGVLGDEVSVSPDGATVYFARAHGCATHVESVPVTGGSPTVIARGSLPAISPDGTKLAIAREPALTTGCVPSESNLVAQYKVVVRTLSSGSQVTYPMLAAGQSSGLPYPISHLSWASDSTRLAVSILSPEDNEGWNLVIMDTATAKYYLAGPGDTFVPATGHPNARDSYLREGVFMPNGDLFVSRACCTGLPVRNTSRLMWEVTTSGTLVHQVAIGFASLEHTSLDVNATGRWLLYLAGDILYVSHDGNTPRQLTTGLIAAAWL